MAFKDRVSRPSRVYRYGCKLAGDRALAYDQMRHANRYRNDLVELERWRRDQVAQFLRDVEPRIEDLEEREFYCQSQIDEKVEQLRKARQQARSRVSLPELEDEIGHLKMERKAVWDELRPLKRETYKHPDFVAKQEELEAEVKTRAKKIRKETPAYWGTYLTVEKSLSGMRSGAPPRFKGFRGDGQVTIQVQNRQPTLQEAMLGRCNLLQISKAQDGKHYDVKIRLSAENGGVWVQCRAKFHRMPPDDAKITWVSLVCRRIGTHDKWSLQFTLARDCWEKNRGKGVVAVNLGWRLRPDGSIRAAYWRDEEGETGELLLPKDVVGRLAESQSLRSIRDKNFDAIKSEFGAWLDAASGLPEWLEEKLKTFAHWRSQARLAAVAIHWRSNRFAGDDDAFDLVETWRKQDRHLLEWEANTRRKYLAWRRNLYRHLAKQLSTRYETLVLANVQWKQIQDKPDDEQPDDMRVARSRKTITAPYELQHTLSQAFHETFKITPKNLTATHAGCGNLSKTADPLSLVHTCETCGEQYDQDDNHCLNLLAAHQAALIGE